MLPPIRDGFCHESCVHEVSELLAKWVYDWENSCKHHVNVILTQCHANCYAFVMFKKIGFYSGYWVVQKERSSRGHKFEYWGYHSPKVHRSPREYNWSCSLGGKDGITFSLVSQTDTIVSIFLCMCSGTLLCCFVKDLVVDLYCSEEARPKLSYFF